MAFKDNLRYLREREQLTQNELAERIGVTQSAISFLEAGEVQPRLITIKALARFFGVAESDLTK